MPAGTELPFAGPLSFAAASTAAYPGSLVCYGLSCPDSAGEVNAPVLRS